MVKGYEKGCRFVKDDPDKPCYLRDGESALMKVDRGAVEICSTCRREKSKLDKAITGELKATLPSTTFKTH
ncbi:MAG: hypothetical protein KAU20_05390 [Nanoarchaeota archaeon]|nr:hypothetical protein [Nanoarchaeota archaeon]